MTKNEKEAIKAAFTLYSYCSGVDCEKCIFEDHERNYCILTDPNESPRWWELSLIKEKIFEEVIK